MTAKENLLNEASKIDNLVNKMLFDHSEIYYYRMNTGDVIYMGPDYFWRELDNEGKKIQTRLISDFNKYISKIKTYLQNIPPQSTRELEYSEQRIREIIEQSKDMGTYNKSIEEAWESFGKEFSAINNLLEYLYSDVTNSNILVVDTNSLLINPNIEEWKFEEFNSFTMILIPTVLSELDNLKINSRNEEVRKKSKLLINKIKEYRRRGNLLDGVTIVKDKIALVCIATEPNFTSSLKFLNPDNNDDRIIAATLEIIQINSGSNLYLVTNDINLQNKAQYSSIPFLEPPED